MADTIELRVQISTELETRLTTIAEALDRPCAWVLEQALDAFIQAENIRQAIAEADSGDFAAPSEVTAAFAKWRKLGRNAG